MASSQGPPGQPNWYHIRSSRACVSFVVANMYGLCIAYGWCEICLKSIGQSWLHTKNVYGLLWQWLRLWTLKLEYFLCKFHYCLPRKICLAILSFLWNYTTAIPCNSFTQTKTMPQLSTSFLLFQYCVYIPFNSIRLVKRKYANNRPDTQSIHSLRLVSGRACKRTVPIYTLHTPPNACRAHLIQSHFFSTLLFRLSAFFAYRPRPSTCLRETCVRFLAHHNIWTMTPASLPRPHSVQHSSTARTQHIIH